MDRGVKFVDAPPARIATERGTVEIARAGEGPALLLLHGAMGGYDQGRLLGQATTGGTGFDFIAVSRPGYLGTPLTVGRTPEEQADLYAAILDALKIRQAAVIAVSGGGQSALQFALRHPDRCSRLVMVSACSAPITTRVPLRFHVMSFLARFPFVVSAMKKKLLADPERAATRSIPDPELRRRTLDDPEAGPLLLALQRSTVERMAERLPGTYNDIEQSRTRFAYPLERIAAPLLVIHGTADQVAPYAQSQALAARAPLGQLLTIEGGEHVSLFTHLALIRRHVAEFLRAQRPEEPNPPVPRREPAVSPSSHSTAS